MGGRTSLLPAANCLKGRPNPIPDAPARDAKHFINGNPLHPPFDEKYRSIMIGMGCYWCSENLFMRHPGVFSSMVGFAGGATPNPTYREVCGGETNHNEVCRLIYDPSQLSLGEILRLFWTKHDPTTPMQQGNDVGTQYRSELYFFSDEDEKLILESKVKFQKVLDAEFGENNKTICTRILDGRKEENKFYYAEEDHQQYDAKPGSRQYCGLRPLKFRQEVSEVLKT